MRAADLIARFQTALAEKFGYIWGSSGQMWTAQSQARTTNQMAQEYGSKWIGHRVADCSGLFSWAAAQLGGYLPHGSNSIFRKYCTETGTGMSQTQPGYAVFKVRKGTKYSDGKDYYHIGLYIGDGKVIEAKSTQKGVVSSRLSEWHAWGRLKGVSYTMETEVDPMVTKTGPAVVDVPNDGTVRVRAKPNGTVKATLPEGKNVNVESIDGEWARVTYSETGYIMTKFLRGGNTDA